MSRNPFDQEHAILDQKIGTGLSKLGQAIRSQAWKGAGSQGLTPTQGQALATLAAAPGNAGLRLAEVAEALGVSRPTASEAVTALVRKGLVVKQPDPADSRAVALSLTQAGREQAGKAALWPDFLHAAVESLDPAERQVFYRALIKMIRSLQRRGQIPVSQMCVTCRYFRPGVHDDPERPHHCAFVDAAFGEPELRLDCPDHVAAEPALQDENWSRFLEQVVPPLNDPQSSP
ncbi:MarR family winged helix-turn-helix transcriptional regulator [Pelagibius sp.]|uniref:MarR family winged helix-turn-helix transcriptional regulator n=1 Tax=Pelagibius sp. TaxID=1931238 RepID=UPI003B507C36